MKELLTIIGVGVGIIGTVFGIATKIRKEIKCIVDTKANKSEVSSEVEKLNIQIVNLTNLYKINQTKIERVEDKIDKLPIFIDQRLDSQFDKIIEILK